MSYVRSDITVCLISCGEETKKDCLHAIRHWRNRIVFQEVKNVSPQIKALNQMLEQANTPYLIPLDADMILDHNAFDRICTAIDKYNHDPSWHSILFKLYDTLTEKEILALKILRTKIMKDHLFKDISTPDVDHFYELTKAGFTCIDSLLNKNPIGLHVVKGKRFCYHKYKDVYQTLRQHKSEWDPGVFLGGHTMLEKSKRHFDFFWKKYLITNDEDYLWCIAGMIDGMTSKNYRKSKNLHQGFKYSAQEGVAAYLTYYMKNYTLCPLLF